jgi:hypothetical protein
MVFLYSFVSDKFNLSYSPFKTEKANLVIKVKIKYSITINSPNRISVGNKMLNISPLFAFMIYSPLLTIIYLFLNISVTSTGTPNLSKFKVLYNI